MGVELVIAPELPDQAVVSLATNKGWSDIIRFTEKLDRKTYPRLRRLTRRGICDDCEALAEELKDLLRDEPPTDEEIMITLTDLLENLDGRGEVSCYVGDPPDDD
jgi:hypothetical protein